MGRSYGFLTQLVEHKTHFGELVAKWWIRKVENFPYKHEMNETTPMQINSWFT